MISSDGFDDGSCEEFALLTYLRESILLRTPSTKGVQLVKEGASFLEMHHPDGLEMRQAMAFAVAAYAGSDTAAIATLPKGPNWYIIDSNWNTSPNSISYFIAVEERNDEKKDNQGGDAIGDEEPPRIVVGMSAKVDTDTGLPLVPLMNVTETFSPQVSKCAKKIHGQLGIMVKAGYQPIIAGYSLGGAVAALTTLDAIQKKKGELLKSLKCYTFGAPVIKVSKRCEEQAYDIITSVVCDDDIVPRLNFNYMEAFCNQVRQFSWLESWAKDLEEDIETSMREEPLLNTFYADEFVEETIRGLKFRSRHPQDMAAQMTTSLPPPDSKLKVPGTCVHISRAYKGAAASKGEDLDLVFSPAIVRAETLIPVMSTTMFNDHSPELYVTAIEKGFRLTTDDKQE